MEVKGKVHKIGNAETFGNYEKRELVIKTDEQYPQLISIEFGQGKCNEYLDKLQIGQEVTVSINLGGREWVNPQGETKYFNSIKGWKVTCEKQGNVPSTSTEATPMTEQQENEDLPF